MTGEELAVVFRDIKIEKKEMIRSERLILRPYRAADRDRLVEIFTNEEIAKTFMIPEYETRAQYYELADKVIAFSRLEDKTHLEYGIYLGDSLIGIVNDCGFFEENAASKRVMEKCGMYLTDTVEEEEYRGRIHRCRYCEKELERAINVAEKRSIR